MIRLIRIIAISYRRRDAERAFQCTNEPIVDGDAEKSRDNPYQTNLTFVPYRVTPSCV
jgi:hypothetical protein